MDPPISTTPRRESQIQGPRPSPLRINKESHKITKKPPIAPKNPNQSQLQHTTNQPIIIYSVSPKPIFVEASNFRSIVQHLTGKDSTASESSFSGEVPVSPAARFASIERTSPGTGILTPTPANLQPISSTMFSPATENQLGFGFGFGELMMSPFYSSFLPSPSALFSSNVPIVSPSPSSFGDLFNSFDPQF